MFKKGDFSTKVFSNFIEKKNILIFQRGMVFQKKRDPKLFFFNSYYDDKGVSKEKGSIKINSI